MATQDDFAAASLQSILTNHLKTHPSFWDGNRVGKPPYPRAISPLGGWVSKASVHNLRTGDGSDLSHLSYQVLMQDPQEKDVSSIALETIPIENKLKMRRTPEGLLASRSGLIDCSDPRGATMKPVVSRSASQSCLVTSEPMPPIQNRRPSSEPSRVSNGELEHGENGTSCDDSDGNNEQPVSDGKGYNASLPPLYCSGDGKKSLGVVLIPPIPKSERPSEGDPGSEAVSLPSSPKDLVFQETLEMRPRSGSGSEDATLQYLELQSVQPVLPLLQHRAFGGMKPAGHLCERVPQLTGFPLSQANKMDYPVNPPLLSDDDLKDSNGRIHIILSKSAQKKIHQKRMRELALLRREREKEREKSLHLTRHSGDPEDATKESFVLPPINGTVSVSHNMSNIRRERAGTALRKRVSRPSLPSIPIISQGGSFPRSSSANSLPTIGLDFLEWGDETECGDTQEIRPFPNPQQGLLNALTWLSSDDWQQKAKALFSIRRLAICHLQVLLCRRHDVSLAVCKEVNNLRSKVSRFAISTLGELFRTMKNHMDHEVDEVVRVLLQKMGDSSEFIQKAANRSLGIMVQSVTPARAMTALMASGIQHHNALVRKCAAEHLLTAMKQIGADKLLSGTRESTELLVRKLVKLAQDCHQDTRCYGRKMLKILMSHRKFDKYLKQSAPSRDLEDVMATIKQKGIDDHKYGPPSAKDHRKPRNSGLTMPQDNLTTNSGLRSGSDVHVLPHETIHCVSFRTAEETEQLKELIRLLTAKDFQTRIQGAMFLLDHCKSSPHFISTNIMQIFDVFVLRLQDCNKKVNQQALEALALMTPMLRDVLHPVLVPLVAAVTDNLNSKHAGIYTAAVKVLEAFVAHLDNALLLQAFAHRVRLLSGQALLDVTECLSVLVASVYPMKPRAAKRYALPVLWFFLGNRTLPVRSGNVRAVVIKLAAILYQLMGSSLKEHAASQPQHVAKNLWEVLDLNVG